MQVNANQMEARIVLRRTHSRVVNLNSYLIRYLRSNYDVTVLCDAYKVMNLLDVMKSFANTDVVGFYKRANLQVAYDDEKTIEYSDHNEYSAYAEQCRHDTDLGCGLTKEALEDMCLNDFVETIQHKWIKTKNVNATVIDDSTKQKFRTRDVGSGHWHLTLCRK